MRCTRDSCTVLLASSMRWSRVCDMFVAAVGVGGGVGAFFLVMVTVSISISYLKITGERFKKFKLWNLYRVSSV